MLGLHILISIVGCFILWVSSNLIIAGTEKLSKTIRTSSFSISLIILGFLTSITEISVGINSVTQNSPGIFVGNLIGGSFVILVFIIPLLALVNKKITFTHHLRSWHLALFIILLVAPIFIIYDGTVSTYEAVALIVMYCVFVYLIETENPTKTQAHAQPHEPIKRPVFYISIFKIVIAAIMVFLVSKLLINEITYFAELVSVSPFVISLLLLSIGTNLPELSIAINSIREKKTEIAFGDYVGSAAANTFLFGVFALIHGPFTIATKSFIPISIIIILGYIGFFMFARSKHELNRKEGAILIAMFFLFIILQSIAAIAF
jgi:cation:H+ antiporter